MPLGMLAELVGVLTTSYPTTLQQCETPEGGSQVILL